MFARIQFIESLFPDLPNKLNVFPTFAQTFSNPYVGKAFTQYTPLSFHFSAKVMCSSFWVLFWCDSIQFLFRFRSTKQSSYHRKGFTFHPFQNLCLLMFSIFKFRFDILGKWIIIFLLISIWCVCVCTIATIWFSKEFTTNSRDWL